MTAFAPPAMSLLGPIITFGPGRPSPPKGRIPDKGAVTGRVGYTHPTAQRQALQPVIPGVSEPRALPLAIPGAQLPQRRFNRRPVSGLGAGESRHSTPKSLFVRRALCAERCLGMTCGR